MKWIQDMDGDWINLDFVTGLRIVENESRFEENDSDHWICYAVTQCMHEEIIHQLFIGSLAACNTFNHAIVDNS